MTNKSSFYVVVLIAIIFPFTVVIAKMRAAYDKLIPLGYEDENGFHLGPEPRF
jgi:hypothetical protein